MFFKTDTLHQFEHKARKLGLKEGITKLLAHRRLIQIGVGLFGIFTPIFLYELFGNRVAAPILFTAAFYFLALILEPLGAKFVTRAGLKMGLVVGVLLLALTYFVYSIGKEIPVPWFVGLVLLFSSIYHVIYWLPYHIEFIELAPKKTRGRVLGYFAATSSLMGIVTPAIAGLMIAHFGYTRLIWVSLVGLGLSLIPLMGIKTVKERYSFGYFQTFQELFRSQNRALFTVYALEGAESVVGSLIWPIFLFQLFKGNYAAVGWNTSIIVAASCVLELVMGFLIEKKSNKKLLRVGVGLSSFGWLIKAFVTTVGQVVFAGVYHSFALIIERAPFDAVMYARAADAGHYIDEYTVLREMALNVGRIAMLLACLVAVSVAGYSTCFVLAALATLGFNYVTRLQPLAPSK